MGKLKLKVMLALRQNAKKQHLSLKLQVPINLQRQKPIRLAAIKAPILVNAVPLHHKQVDVANVDNTKMRVAYHKLHAFFVPLFILICIDTRYTFYIHALSLTSRTITTNPCSTASHLLLYKIPLFASRAYILL